MSIEESSDRVRPAGTPSLLRDFNDRTTLGLLFDKGPLSKTELRALTGLSKPTVGQSLSRLTALGLVRAGGSRTGPIGPAATIFEIDPGVGAMVMVEVGNYAVRGVAVTIAGEKTPEAEVDPLGRDVIDVLEEIHGTLTRHLPLADGAQHMMVVAVSGAYDARDDLVRHGGHLSARVAGLEEPGLLRRLRAQFGENARVENDVNLVALGEHAEGIAVGSDTTVLLWADAGVGTAEIIDGKIHRGATGSAGELAFLPVLGSAATASDEPEGGFQAWAGGEAVTALGEDHHLAGTPVQMLQTAVADESAHSAFLQALAERYATGITALIAVLDPDLVVLSGSYAFAGGPVLSAQVADLVARKAMRAVPVVLGALSDSPVLAGATSLARRRHRRALLDRVGPTA